MQKHPNQGREKNQDDPRSDPVKALHGRFYSNPTQQEEHRDHTNEQKRPAEPERSLR
jgi:hypothetical protein